MGEKMRGGFLLSLVFFCILSKKTEAGSTTNRDLPNNSSQTFVVSSPTRPNASKLSEALMETIYGHNLKGAVWFYKHHQHDSLREYLKSIISNPKLVEELLIENLSETQKWGMKNLHQDANGLSSIYVPDHILKQLSDDDLKIIYRDQYAVAKNNSRAPSFSSRQAWEEFADRHNIGHEKRLELEKFLYAFSPPSEAGFSKNSLILDPNSIVWSKLPNSAKSEIINLYVLGIEELPTNSHYSAKYKVNSLDEVLDLLIRLNPHANIEDLRIRAKKLYTEAVPVPKLATEIPVEKFLPPPTATLVGDFAECMGPNCHNLAHQFDPITFESRRFSFQEARKVPHDLKKIHYNVLQGDEVPLPGDLIVFRDSFEQNLHTAVYLGDGMAFTKNGVLQDQAYVFQPIEILKNEYGNQIQIWRHLNAQNLSQSPCAINLAKIHSGFK